jgi:3-hydroxymyristoyl/3-hydroxydecanoyl-(acyl carrier protein) dehydratase
MNVNEIMGLLPHRYPMLMVDRVVDYVANERILAYKNITVNEEVFNGHFPGAPIFPGVMTIEALAQASGFCRRVVPQMTANSICLLGLIKLDLSDPLCPVISLCCLLKLRR